MRRMIFAVVVTCVLVPVIALAATRQEALDAQEQCELAWCDAAEAYALVLGIEGSIHDYDDASFAYGAKDKSHLTPCEEEEVFDLAVDAGSFAALAGICVTDGNTHYAAGRVHEAEAGQAFNGVGTYAPTPNYAAAVSFWGKAQNEYNTDYDSNDACGDWSVAGCNYSEGASCLDYACNVIDEAATEDHCLHCEAPDAECEGPE